MLKFTLSSILLTTALCLSAQTDSTLFIGARDTTTVGTMNMDAVKNRPLMRLGQIPVNVGGYASVKAEHLGEDGITDGLSFSMQRFTLFLSSTISERVSFATEIEFEEGAEEIGIEFAAIDLEFSQLVNLRAGIVMNPIGRFNENHDDPRWDFVDRPISATQLLPATWSNVGFGLYGRKRVGSFNLGYEAYLTNGFNDAIISNADARTSLPASKEDPGRFGESFNGVPMFTARLAAQHPRWGEIGISHMGGVYNKFANDGEIVDDRRRVDVFAVDGTCTINPLRTTITGEFAWIKVDVPETYTQQFGSYQYGGFLDVVRPILKGQIFGFPNATLNLAARFEYVDWNVGSFQETGGEIGDDVLGIVPAISFRPSAMTAFRLNYRYQSQRDILNNPAARTGGLQVGISSYF